MILPDPTPRPSVEPAMRVTAPSGQEAAAPDLVPRPGSAAPTPEPCLAGVRVIVAGRNRAARLRSVLDALGGAALRGAEVVYVDGGSRDRSLDVARVHRTGPVVLADLVEALEPLAGGEPPRYVAAVSLRAEADWRCLRTLLRSAARSEAGALHVPSLVGPDGRLPGGPDDDLGLAHDANATRRTPAVWLGRAREAALALTGTWAGPVRRRRDARALLVETATEPSPAGGTE